MKKPCNWLKPIKFVDFHEFAAISKKRLFDVSNCEKIASDHNYLIVNHFLTET